MPPVAGKTFEIQQKPLRAQNVDSSGGINTPEEPRATPEEPSNATTSPEENDSGSETATDTFLAVTPTQSPTQVTVAISPVDSLRAR